MKRFLTGFTTDEFRKQDIYPYLDHFCCYFTIRWIFQLSKLIFSHFHILLYFLWQLGRRIAVKRSTKVGRSPTLFSKAVAILPWDGRSKVQIEDLWRSVWCFSYLFTNHPKSHSDDRLLNFQMNFNIQMKIQFFAFQLPFYKSSLLNLLLYAMTHLPRKTRHAANS